MNRFSLSHLAAVGMVVSVGLMVGAILTVAPTPSQAAKGGKGGGGGNSIPDGPSVRAFFHANQEDLTPTALQSDVAGSLSIVPPTAVVCTDPAPDFDDQHYTDPTDVDCLPIMDPAIVRSNLLFSSGAWRFFIEGEAETDEVVIDRWASLKFDPAEVIPNDKYQGSFELTGNCPNLDDFLYNDPALQEDPNNLGVANDGGIPVSAPNVDVDACVDNVVIGIGTDSKLPIFDIDDGDVKIGLGIWAPTPPASELGGTGRFWEPRFALDYGTWKKESTLDPDVVVLRSTGSHEADLVEAGNGPASKRRVATFGNLPVEITIKRVPPTP